jgi:uncharacterized protein
MSTVLITGGSGGIGYELAKLFARDRHNLILVARSGDKLAQVASELQGYGVTVKTLTLDLGEAHAPKFLFDQIQGEGISVDILINNAGFGNRGAFLDVPLQAELDMLKVHVEAILRTTSAALPGMRERGRGGIVNVASVAAFLPRGTYGATKAWVVNFTQGIARDVAGSGVRLQALCPGFTRTEFHERAGMGISGIPRWGWLSADRVVEESLRDLARGRTLSVPSRRYKAVVAIARLLPAGGLGSISSKAARSYRTD